MRASGVLAHAASVSAMPLFSGDVREGMSDHKEYMHDLRRLAVYPWLPDPKVCATGSDPLVKRITHCSVV
jgi:hypothetical protein